MYLSLGALHRLWKEMTIKFMLGLQKGRSDQTVTIYDGHFTSLILTCRSVVWSYVKIRFYAGQVAGAAACGRATADFSGELMGARVSAFKFD